MTVKKEGPIARLAKKLGLGKSTYGPGGYASCWACSVGNHHPGGTSTCACCRGNHTGIR